MIRNNGAMPSCGIELLVKPNIQILKHLAFCATAVTRRTIPTALGSYHQPGQRASAC